MAWSMPVQGDKFNEYHMVRKQAKAAYAASALVGDLVIADSSLPNCVDLIAADEAIYGIVMSLNQKTDGSNLSVQELTPGSYVILPYTGTVAIGDKVEFSSATQDTVLLRTKVKTDNTNGSGYVTAIDADTSAGTGYCCVRF